jgi:NAD(P)-dependent dehydrogenase (short-subunit alcohol dehydrogenase family)
VADTPQKAVIVGVGPGLSASFARLLARAGWQVALAARDLAKLAPLAAEIGAATYPCDVTDKAQIDAIFQSVGTPDLVHFNPSYRTRGPVAELDPGEVERTLAVSAFGGFLVAQAAAKRMLANGHGTIVFTGASASVKGYPLSAPFAMGKFALRGLAQSMARELHPKNIHILHVVVDGGIASARREMPADAPDSLLDPDAIAETMMTMINQPRSAWTDEITVRPWVERF